MSACALAEHIVTAEGANFHPDKLAQYNAVLVFLTLETSDTPEPDSAPALEVRWVGLGCLTAIAWFCCCYKRGGGHL